jgi:hypothetical protein
MSLNQAYSEPTLFSHEDRGSMFLRNGGVHPQNYMESQTSKATLLKYRCLF